MDCKKVQRQLADYLLGELDAKQEIRISEHLVHCGTCTKKAESLEDLFRSIGDEQRIEPSKKILERIRMQTGIRGPLTPLAMLLKPIRLYHALATLALGIILATISNVVIEKRAVRAENTQRPYRAIHEQLQSDSVTFYTAPSHRIGGT